MSFLLDNSINSDNCQERISRIASRIRFKDALAPSVSQVFLANSYRASSKEKASRFSSCGKYLDIDTETGRIQKANFCKERLCPVCNYLKSCNNWRKIKLTVDEIREREKDTQFIFITLTVRNCPPDELKKTIDELMAGFKRLTNRKSWKRCIAGTLRGVEITYNSESNTFHPHIHILAAVPSSYFESNYITIAQLREWWTQSAQLDYFVQVDIRKTTGDSEAISEVAKYSIKTAEILSTSNSDQKLKAVSMMHSATYGRRLIATTGIFKEVMKSLEVGDLDEVLPSGADIKEGVILIWSESEKNFIVKE